MTKPKEQTVDYFPHFHKQGKTIYAVTKKHKGSGKLFMWCVLELLADSKGHFYDCNDPYDWEYLIDYTWIGSDKKANELIDILIRVGMLDKDLWRDNKILWSDSFVDNLESLYSRRTCGFPEKPKLLSTKAPLSGTQRGVSGNDSEHNPTESAKYTKLDNIIVDKKDTYTPIFKTWNSLNIIVHRKITDKMKTPIRVQTKIYSEPEIIKAIENYSTVIKSDKHYFNHKWTLEDFLNRGLGKFSDEADPLKNFLNNSSMANNNHQHGDKKPSKEELDQYDTFYWWCPDEIIVKDKTVKYTGSGEWVDYDHWQNYCSNELLGIGFYNQDGTQRTEKWETK